MTKTIYRLIDTNTGEEVYASEGFRFLDAPLPNHRILDADLLEHYGAPAVVDRVETDSEGTVLVYIDAVEEQLNDDDPDQND
jgi:hypothetical protein